MEYSKRHSLESILSKIPAERVMDSDLSPRNMRKFYFKVNIIGNSSVGKTSLYSTLKNGYFKDDI